MCACFEMRQVLIFLCVQCLQTLIKEKNLITNCTKGEKKCEQYSVYQFYFLIRCEKIEFPECKWEIITRTKHAADFTFILLLFSAVQRKHFHFKRVWNVRYTTSKQQHKGKSNVLFNTLKTAISKNERNGLCDKKKKKKAEVVWEKSYIY